MAHPGICSIEGCGKSPLMGRGWCRSHYHRWYRYGDPCTPKKRHPTWKGQQCSIEGCDRPIKGRGICDAHRAARKRQERPDIQKRVEENAKSRYLQRREGLLGRPRPEVCELCGSPPYPRRVHRGGIRIGICYDHCHATGKPRGWLCDRCNKVLGMVKDSPALLRKLAAYLEEHANG